MGSKNKNKQQKSNNGNSGQNGHADEVVANDIVEQEVPLETEKDDEVDDTKDDSKDDTKDQVIAQLQKQVEELTISMKEKDQLNVARANGDNDNNEVIESLKAQLEAKTKENETNEAQYRNLLGKLSGMKSLFEKMKNGERDLEISESQRLELLKKIEQTEQEKNILINTLKDLKEEIKNLNNECESLNSRNQFLNTELTNTRDELEKISNTNKRLLGQVKELTTNQEEYLIMMNEEKLLRQNLSNKISDLQQVLEFKDNEIKTHTLDKAQLYEKLTKLDENLIRTTSELDIKGAQYSNDLKNLENQLQSKDEIIADLQKTIDSNKEEISRLIKLEKDNKDKQLQIGKLRHELIILNDHLTKALKLIKKDSDNDSVDKQLVSNLFISFLNLPRGDSKKFELLELIANFLNWDKDMRIHAGIQNKSRGAGDSNRSRQSFVSLWTEYLEKESTQEGKLDT